MSGEQDYIKLVAKVLDSGELRETRNAKVYSLFGEHLEFKINSLEKDNTFSYSIPRFTTKYISFKNVFEELIFFLNGETDSKKLENKGINIWKGNTSKEFLKSRNLDYSEGDMGPMYGFQWNHFGADYKGCDQDYKDQGINQIDDCINLIKTDPMSRRIIFTALDPFNLNKMVLAPCHCVFQFYVRGGKYLDGQLYQRSADLMLGVPYNVLSYSLLILMVARQCNLHPGVLKITFGDVHIYSSHLEGAIEQIRRKPGKEPVLFIKNEMNTPIRDYKLTDFVFESYVHQPVIKMKMIA